MRHKNIKYYGNRVLSNKWFNPILGIFIILGAFCFSYATAAFAADELDGIMESAKGNFGSNSTFIKLLYAAEIIAGGYAWHKTKHPSAIIGIVVLALFMTFALKHWVFE